MTRPSARAVTAEARRHRLLVAVVVGSGIFAQRLSPGRRRPPAPRELRRHGRRAGRADPGLRVGLRRPLQPRRDPGRPLPRRHRHPRRWRLHRRPRSLGACAGAVVANLMFDLDAVDWSTHDRSRRRALARRGRRHVRAPHRHPRRRPLRARRRRSVRGRRLHRRRLLVHVLDQLRQPGRHRRPDADRHLRRHRARRRCPRSSSRRSLGAALAVAAGSLTSIPTARRRPRSSRTTTRPAEETPMPI